MCALDRLRALSLTLAALTALAAVPTAPLAALDPGDLDPSFNELGTPGWVAVDQPAGTDYGTDVAVDELGRVYLASLERVSDGVGGYDDYARVRRFTAGGALDGSFASGGVRTIPVVPPTTASPQVAIHPTTGDVYVGTDVDISGSDDVDWRIERLDQDGDFLEAEVVAFQHGGSQIDRLFDLAAAGSRVAAVGKAQYSGGDTDFAIAVLDATTLAKDPTWSGDGLATQHFDLGGDLSDAANAVAFDGAKVVVVGTARTAAGTVGAIARYDSAGSLDGSFSGDGKATYAFRPALVDPASIDGYFVDVEADAGGILWIAASTTHPTNLFADRDFALVKVGANGEEDLAFGVRGWRLVPFEFPFQGSSVDYAASLALGPEGVTLAGDITSAATAENLIALARLTTGGALDPSFGGGGNGKVLLSVSPTYDQVVFSMARDGWGRLLVAGKLVPGGGGGDAYALRLVGDTVFADGFESGDRSAWSSAVP